MRLLILMNLLVVGFPVFTFAQAIRVTPLFGDSGMVTNLSIPFEVSSEDLQVDSIHQVEVIGNDSCRSLVNSISKKTFLVKCLAGGEFRVRVGVMANSKQVFFTYGDIPMRDVSSIGSPVGGSPVSEDLLLGKTLFEKKAGDKLACIDCHQPGDSLIQRGLSASSLKLAFDFVPGMKNATIWSYKRLTDKEIDALVLYIKSK